MRRRKEMKTTIDIDLEKYLNKKTENDYLEIDRLGIIWICHDTMDSTNSKHFKIASDDELKEWGIENRELYN